MKYCKYCNELLTVERYRCGKCGMSQLENKNLQDSIKNDFSTWGRLNKKISIIGYLPTIYLFSSIAIGVIVYLYLNQERFKRYSSMPYYGLFEYIATVIISMGFSVSGIVVGSKLSRINKLHYLIVVPCWLVLALDSVCVFLVLPYVLIGYFITIPASIVSSLLIWHSSRIHIQKIMYSSDDLARAEIK